MFIEKSLHISGLVLIKATLFESVVLAHYIWYLKTLVWTRVPTEKCVILKYG